MTDWLLILTAVVVLWVLWLFMGYVADLIAYAVRRHEASSPTKGKGSC